MLNSRTDHVLSRLCCLTLAITVCVPLFLVSGCNRTPDGDGSVPTGTTTSEESSPAERKLDSETAKRWRAEDLLYYGQICFLDEDWQEAIDYFDEAAELAPDYADAYLYRAFSYENLGREDLAITDLGIAIDLDPGNWIPFHERGLLLYRANDPDGAIADFTRVLSFDLDNEVLAEAHYYRGVVYRSMEDYEDYEAAILDYTRAIEVKSDYVDAYINRGFARRALGRHEEAIADYSALIKLHPENGAFWRSRAAATFDAGRRDEAFADWEEAYRLAPNDPHILDTRGGFYNMMEQYSLALVDFDRAVELDPSRALTHQNRGLALVGLNRLEEALQSMGRAIELDETFATAYGQRAEVLLKLNRLDEAGADLAKAIEICPVLVNAYYYRAQLHRKLGNDEQAEADLAEVRRLGFQPRLVDGELVPLGHGRPGPDLAK